MGVTIELYIYCIGLFNSSFSRTKMKIATSSSTGQIGSLLRRIPILFVTILCLHIYLTSRIYSSASSHSAFSCSSSPVRPSTWIQSLYCPIILFHSTLTLSQPPPWANPPAPPWSIASTSPWPTYPRPSCSSPFLISGVYIVALASRSQQLLN